MEIGRSIKQRLFVPKTVDVSQRTFPSSWKPINSPQPSANKQLRVLVLSHMFPHPDQPGTGSFVHEQVRALREHSNIDARVLAGRPDWILSKNLVTMWTRLKAYEHKFNTSSWWDFSGVPVKYIPYKIIAGFWSHGWMYRMAMMQAALAMRAEFPFELIHAHTGYLDGSAGMAIARRCDVPLFITEHTGPFSVLTSNPIVKHCTLKALNNSACVIVVSEAQKRNVAVHMPPNRRGNIRIIPNGVNLKVFYHAGEWSPNPSAPRILFVGFFAPVKKIPLLIEAFALVRHELPEAELTLVGGGNFPQEKSKIKNLINQMGLEEAVSVMEYRPRDEIARMMREECDMLVLSSQSETFGVALIEALASGRPVVATRCGGPEDIVDDPALGELCSPGDAQTLAAAILKVAHHLPQYKPDYIRENAAKRFSFERIAKAIRREYADVLRLEAKI